MGLIAFILPNEHAVYLHDSPQRHLYAWVRRDFSHGSFRVEDAKALAGWVLWGDPPWAPERIDEVYNGSSATQVAALVRAIPGRIVYRKSWWIPPIGLPVFCRTFMVWMRRWTASCSERAARRRRY